MLPRLESVRDAALAFVLFVTCGLGLLHALWGAFQDELIEDTLALYVFTGHVVSSGVTMALLLVALAAFEADRAPTAPRWTSAIAAVGGAVVIGPAFILAVRFRFQSLAIMLGVPFVLAGLAAFVRAHTLFSEARRPAHAALFALCGLASILAGPALRLEMLQDGGSAEFLDTRVPWSRWALHATSAIAFASLPSMRRAGSFSVRASAWTSAGLLVVGGSTTVFLANLSPDIHLADTMYPVGALHAEIFGILFAVIAHHLRARVPDARAPHAPAVGVLLAGPSALALAVLMMSAGAQGMPRRYMRHLPQFDRTFYAMLAVSVPLVLGLALAIFTTRARAPERRLEEVFE